MMSGRKMRVGTSLAVGLFAVCASQGFAQTTSHLSGNYVFTGSSSITSMTVQTNLESPQTIPPFTLVAPGFIFPELDTPRTLDTADGFSLLGRYDFLNGTGTGAQVTITASRPLTVTNTTTTASDLAGAFGIDSADFTNLVTGTSGDAPVAAVLQSFTVQTYLTDPAHADATAQSASGAVPVAVNFPNGAFTSTGPEATADASTIPSGTNTLVQVVTLNFTGLLPGESVDILLPEPSTTSAALLLVGGLVFFANRRRRVIA
jgi:hypothetical protein